MLDGALFSSNSSIREFQQGRAGYVIDSVKQALLLPQDMEELKNLKKHEVFLILKKDWAMVRSDIHTYIYIYIHIYFLNIFSL